MKGTMIGLLVVLLAGCSATRQGAPYVANPVVVGGLQVATRNQCERFAQEHAVDAAATRDYLRAVQGAVDACIEGLNLGMPAATPTP